MDLDLRIGAILTRFQSLSLQREFEILDSKVISYGPCQFPTLGFVVDQYERVQRFRPETFWYIDVKLERDGSTVTFKWDRTRLFDEAAAYILCEACVNDPEATVTRVQTKPTSKWSVDQDHCAGSRPQETAPADDGRAAKGRLASAPSLAQADARCSSERSVVALTTAGRRGPVSEGLLVVPAHGDGPVRQGL